jgi:HEAT repeat protein
VLDVHGQARAISGALEDPSPLVSMIAARALARPELTRYAPVILGSIHRFEGWSPRFLSSMLASMGKGAAPILRDTLAQRQLAVEQRTVAADALRRLGDVDAAAVALAVLEEPIHRDLHCSTLRLLGAVGQAEHAEAIRRLTGADDPVVRAQAVRALGRIGDGQDAASLREAANDRSPWVVIHALRGLREVGRDDMVEELSHSEHASAGFARQVLAEAV